MFDPRNFVWRHNLRVPRPNNIAFVDLNDEIVDCSRFDFVFFYWMEAVQCLKTFLQNLKNTYNCNHCALIGGGFELHDLSDLPANVMYHPQWLDQTVNFNRDYTKDVCTGPFFFDALFGRPNPHRLYIFNCITKSRFEDKFLYNIDIPNFFSSRVYELEIDFIQKLKSANAFNSMTRLPQEYHSAFISQIIPKKIYQKSWFSIVPETNAELFFPTEKTFKPILAQRIFVPMAGQNFLKKLTELGFMTFENCIDESFDREKNLQSRQQKVWTQIEYMLKQDPKKLHASCAHQLQHNRQLCLDKPYWSSRLQTFINANL